MKIVHVIIGLNVGGAELMLKRLIESHVEQYGVEHVVVSLTDKGMLGEGLEDSGISVHCLGMHSLLKGPVVLFKLRRLLLRLKPDIVHTWMYHSDFLGGLAAKSVGIKNVVWCVRSTDITKGGSKLTLLVRRCCAWLSERLPATIVCAAEASRKIHEKIGYSPDKMVVIPNGFDLNKLEVTPSLGLAVRDELDIKSNYKVVISVGRFNPVKDHATFISAAGIVASLHDDVRFILVGRDLDATNAKLMSMLKKTGYAHVFYLLGERSDVPACLRAADVFCLHSATEGFPNVLGEAMAVGLPCITTDVGDAAYLLDNPEWVVPPLSPSKLADKINAFLQLSVADRVGLGEMAAHRIYDNFSMDVVVRRYHELYVSLCD